MVWRTSLIGSVKTEKEANVASSMQIWWEVGNVESMCQVYSGAENSASSIVCPLMILASSNLCHHRNVRHQLFLQANSSSHQCFLDPFIKPLPFSVRLQRLLLNSS